MSICRACAKITSGDCGMHGPRLFIVEPQRQTYHPQQDRIAELEARVAALTAALDDANARAEGWRLAAENDRRQYETLEQSLQANRELHKPLDAAGGA